MYPSNNSLRTIDKIMGTRMKIKLHIIVQNNGYKIKVINTVTETATNPKAAMELLMMNPGKLAPS